MSSFLLHNNNSSTNEVDELLNPTRNLLLQSRTHKDKNFAVSYLKSSPLKGERILDNEKWMIIFSGDIIEYDSIPFKEIILNIEQNQFENFAKFNGIFGIIAYNKDSDLLFIISDRRAQYPIFYLINETSIIVSSELSIFTRLLDQPEFNEDWLHDYLYFNYPIAYTTFIKNINRLPPATCLKVDMAKRSLLQKKYAENYSQHKNLAEGNKALELAASVLGERIPVYLIGSDEVACALTGGWDGRTNLALAPKTCNVTTYTYGTKQCSDIRNTKKMAANLGIKHKELFFDDKFIQQIPDLIFETVYLSSGLQGILRASLLFAYKELTANALRFPLTISGINYDGLFRGHFGIPSIVSKHIEHNLVTGDININEKYWENIFKSSIGGFLNNVSNKLKYLEEEFGELKLPSHHINYFIYNAGPNYFVGEMRIANHFTTVRVPAWDNDIIELAFKIKNSSLSYSQMAGHKRGQRDEMVLQSYIIRKFAPEIAGFKLRNITPNAVLYGEIPFRIYRLNSKISNRLKMTLTPNEKSTPLENWDLWFNKIHRGIIDSLIFGKESLIQQYIKPDYLNSLRVERDLLTIGRLTTAEIILRLINNRWNRFW